MRAVEFLEPQAAADASSCFLPPSANAADLLLGPPGVRSWVSLVQAARATLSPTEGAGVSGTGSQEWEGWSAGPAWIRGPGGWRVSGVILLGFLSFWPHHFTLSWPQL